jgi:uncharacterized protein
MTPTFALVLIAALVVGVLIGCVGIGGVLLPPALVYLGGFGFHAAAATSTWAFLFCGAAGTLSYSGRRSIDWRMAAWLGAGVVPTAFVGALANAALPEGLLMAILAALMVLTGTDALLRSPDDAGRTSRRLGAPALLAVGAFVGFGSALTGTGGAVLLVPILLLLRTPVLASVGAAQAVALPIVGFSTAGYVLYGSVDFALGTAAGLVGAVGVVVGARIAHAAPAAALRRVVATALLCVGLLIAARTVWGATVGESGRPSDVRPTPNAPNVVEGTFSEVELLLNGILRSSPYSTHRPRASGRPVHTSDHYSPGSLVSVDEAGTLAT